MGTDSARSTSTRPTTSALPVGTKLGRYVVLGSLGYGGMSTVMLAHDTKLDRRIALKVLRPDATSEESRMRMVREAQALAQLSHPNVVAVFDVESDGDLDFVAMEHIDGTTLTAWCGPERPWKRVVTILKEAAKGLAAAHQAGFVHRDFKPDNVMLAKDGRVCVLDFGLVRTSSSDAKITEMAPRSALPRKAQRGLEGSTKADDGVPWAMRDALTEQGSILGTVGYFAPETIFDGVADARSDVFSFCITLWRALYGTMPFPSQDLGDYVQALGDGEPAHDRPAHSRVPLWIHAVIRRGIALDPSRRFASMTEVLEALERNPWRRRIGAGAAVLTALVATTLVLAHLRHDQRIRVECAASSHQLGEAWSTEARRAVQNAILQSGDGAGERTERTLSALDAYAASWRDEEQSSCLAARLDTKVPLPVYEQQTACLLGGSQLFTKMVGEMTREPPKSLRTYVLDAVSLPAPSLCNRENVERDFAPLPVEPEARAKASEARRLLLEAAPMDVESRRAAVTLAHDAKDPADEVDALIAVGYALGTLYDDTGAVASFERAMVLAEREGLDRRAARCASALAYYFTAHLHQKAQGRQWSDIARAKATRVGADDQLDLLLLENEATLDLAEGSTRKAIDEYERASTLTTRRLGEHNVQMCHLEAKIAAAIAEDDRPAESVKAYESAMDCERREVGTDDPWLRNDLVNYGAVVVTLGRFDDAYAAYSESLSLGRSHGEGTGLSYTLAERAHALNRLGRFDEAVRDAEEALSIADNGEDGVAKDGVWLASHALGEAKLGLGDAAAARAACVRASRVGDAIQAPSLDTVYYIDSLGCAGEAEIALGDVVAARAHLEASVLLTKRNFREDLPRARFALARAVDLGTDADPTRALALATQAKRELEAMRLARPWVLPLLAKVTQWTEQRSSVTRL